MFRPLSFWINAFIPKTVPNYTITVPGGPHAGKTAIPLPGAARLNPLNLFKNLDAGYLTDQRGFSTDPYASVRMQSIATVDVEAQTMQLQKYREKGERDYHNTSGTTEVDTSTGEVLGWKLADMKRCSFTSLQLADPAFSHFMYGVYFPTHSEVNNLHATTTTVHTSLVGMAGDPLVSGAADIDYTGHLWVSLVKAFNKLLLVQVNFQGKIDAFPAFEAYASFRGVTKTLFQASPPKGNTVVDLLGGAERHIQGIAIFRQGIDF